MHMNMCLRNNFTNCPQAEKSCFNVKNRRLGENTHGSSPQRCLSFCRKAVIVFHVGYSNRFKWQQMLFMSDILFQGFSQTWMPNRARKMSLRRMKRAESPRPFKNTLFGTEYPFALRCLQAWKANVATTCYSAWDIPGGDKQLSLTRFCNVPGKRKTSMLCLSLAQSLWVHEWKENEDFRLWRITVGLLITKRLSWKSICSSKTEKSQGSSIKRK